MVAREARKKLRAPAHIRRRMHCIHRNFLAADAEMQVNLSYRVHRLMLEAIALADGTTLPPDSPLIGSSGVRKAAPKTSHSTSRLVPPMIRIRGTQSTKSLAPRPNSAAASKGDNHDASSVHSETLSRSSDENSASGMVTAAAGWSADTKSLRISTDQTNPDHVAGACPSARTLASSIMDMDSAEAAVTVEQHTESIENAGTSALHHASRQTPPLALPQSSLSKKSGPFDLAPVIAAVEQARDEIESLILFDTFQRYLIAQRAFTPFDI
ncbi:hypothetical protein THASP1DRAFT_31551 [Thamnocephalis sphaerospora]|uniref:RGS domain-containing protein n=1 Tax=Thamnocephalis sphaerospora TaxID=78915 RepID=A0A4P9XLA3_9FUNG|nr:hypothetical protein THASP1DRAFT_31551 [Thamnocephalis sphaerospora]|eukprot:RKP06634.1 hypothetical protein THASP1DRAFT_31551 [Thamnocephalis sphaerospora]